MQKTMETEAEELQLLEVGEEDFNIFLCSSLSEMVQTLASTLLLPLSFATLVLCLMPSPWRIYQSNYGLFNIDSEPVDNQITTLVSTGFQQLGTTNGVLEFWLLSTAAVMYTAASIYIAKAAAFPNTETVVPGFWKRLALTLLCFLTVVLAHTTVYILASFLVIYSVGFDKYANSRDFLFKKIPILAFFFCVLVYVNMIGYLASATCVLQEQYYSLASMRKRRAIIKGKQTTVLSLFMFYFIFSQGAGTFWYGDAGPFWYAYAGMERAVPATLLGGSLCLVILGRLVTQTEV